MTTTTIVRDQSGQRSPTGEQRVDASRNPGCLSSAPRRTTRSTLGAFSGQRRRRGGELRQVRLNAAIGAAFDLRQLRCDGPSFECHAVQRRAGEREWEMEVETRPRAPTSTWPAIGCRARRIRAVISGCSSGASERARGRRAALFSPPDCIAMQIVSLAATVLGLLTARRINHSILPARRWRRCSVSE